MYAANRQAMPALGKPYSSGAPEVESLLRLREAGLHVVEVPVHMRDRASGESKLRGRKAVRPRAHGREHAARLRAMAPASETLSQMRLVAVLGYSDRRTSALHPVCAARLARAENEVLSDDSVLFSGWARRKTFKPEAELMARAWRAPARQFILDRNARSTVGNALGVARAARGLGA